MVKKVKRVEGMWVLSEKVRSLLVRKLLLRKLLLTLLPKVGRFI